MNFDTVIITTGYPGSSAEDVEKLVTISIERQLKGVDGIKTLNGLSQKVIQLFIWKLIQIATLVKLLMMLKSRR